MTVYADILFIVNLYVDALLISAVRRFLRLSLPPLRLAAAALLGGVFGLSALLPALPRAALLPLGLIEALLLTAAAFCPVRPKTLLKAAFLLVLFGAVLSGLISALPLRGAAVLNGAVYFDISAVTLIFCTTLAYGVLCAFERLFKKRAPDALFRRCEIEYGGQSVTLTARVDTGMTLAEPFSGQPVLVAEERALKALLPAGFGTAQAEIPLRLVPFSTVSGEGLLPAFRPDSATVSGARCTLWVAVSARPLSAGSFNALLPAQYGDYLQNEEGKGTT